MTDRVFKELTRIWGKDAADAERGLVLLPLASEKEALAFLQTVATGTSITDLPRLAEEFRHTRKG